MDPLVVGLVALAAVMHVAWNVLLKTADEPLKAGTIGMATGSVILVPVGIAGWLMLGRPSVPLEAFALGVASGLFEAAYFVLLSAAYFRGDLSVVYPIARGTAPLLAVVIGVGLLGEQIHPAAWLGVGLLLAGILALQQPWQVVARARRARSGARAGGSADTAIVFAFLTGLAIVAYSGVDRVGARLVPVWLYAAILWPVTAVTLVAWSAARGRSPFPVGGQRARAVVGGVLTLAAYSLILVAYTRAPLAVVAPLRESAIVLASGWGAFRLAEATGRRDAAQRLGAASLVLAGAVVLALEA